MEHTDKSKNRRTLLDMVTGRRSGYWVEVIHHATTGAAAYILHRPEMQGAAPRFPMCWEAVRILAAKYLNREDAADTLPKHDDGRAYTGEVQPLQTARVCAKWCKFA